MNAQKLLDRLDRVRSQGPGRWTARCPAHEDVSPSLSICEKDDGRVLVHCFADCDVPSIVGAVGLGLEDLFPPRDPGHCRPVRRPWTAAQLLHLVDHETLIVAIVAADAVAGGKIEPAHLERLALARRRLATIMRELPPQ